VPVAPGPVDNTTIVAILGSRVALTTYTVANATIALGVRARVALATSLPSLAP